MRVGVIGLGNIGGAIAANLVADGHEVTVADLDPARRAVLIEAGARWAAGAEALAETCEITFLSLPTSAIVDAVSREWLAGAARGSVLVDLSTNSPAAVRALGERVCGAGCELLEAPLTGGAPGAKARTLVFLVGGEVSVYGKVKPLLDALGRASFHVGRLGLGNTAKLVNSLLAFTTTLVSLEGLSLAAAAGIPLRTMVEIVRTGGASNFYVDRVVDGLDRRGRPVQFAIELAAKDAALVTALGAELGVPSPLAEGIATMLREAADSGFAPKDWSDLVEWIERQSNQRLRLHIDQGLG